MIELSVALLFALLLVFSLKGGWPLALLSTIGLIALMGAALQQELPINIVAVLGIWLLVFIGCVPLVRRLRPARRRARRFLLGATLATIQAGVVTVLVSGSLLAQNAAIEPIVLSSAIYPIIANAGSALPDNQQLAFPDPLASTPHEEKAADVRPIEWATAQTFDGTVSRILPGSIRAAEQAPIGFEATGRISDVFVEIGDSFAEGDILATQDDVNLQSALTERQAALVEAEARHTEAVQNLSRQQKLFERNVISSAALEGAQASMDAAASRLGVARTAIQQAEDQLADAVLRAPFDGTVARRLVEQAQTIQRGEPAFELQGTRGGYQVAVTVPEALIGHLERGSEHRARLIDGTNTPLILEVHDISARANASTGFPVILSVVATQRDVRAGMSAEVTLLLHGLQSNTEDAVSVPISAILPHDNDSHIAFVFDVAAGRLAERTVDVSGYENGRALISAGLTEGEIVATHGLPFLSDGLAVVLRGVGIARYDF